MMAWNNLRAGVCGLPLDYILGPEAVRIRHDADAKKMGTVVKKGMAVLRGCLCSAILLAASSAHAETWLTIANGHIQGQQATMYVDKDSIAHTGSRTRFWDRMRFDTPATIPDVPGPVTESRVNYSVDCVTRAITVVDGIYTDAAGKVLLEDKMPYGPYTPEQMGPIMNTELATVCR